MDNIRYEYEVVNLPLFGLCRSKLMTLLNERAKYKWILDKIIVRIIKPSQLVFKRTIVIRSNNS